MTKTIITFLAGAVALTATSGVVNVESFDYTGARPLRQPLMIDSVDISSKKYETASLLDQPMKMTGATSRYEADVMPGHEKSPALHGLTFTAENRSFVTVTVNTGCKSDDRLALFVDGKKTDGKNLKLEPATHTFAIKYLSVPGETDSLAVTIETERPELLTVGNDKTRMITLGDIIHGRRVSYVSLSPDGKMLLTVTSNTLKDGKVSYNYRITSLADGRTLTDGSRAISWLPRSNRYRYTRNGLDGRELVSVDPVTGDEQVMATGIPEGRFNVAPTEDFLIYTLVDEGEKEGDVYQVLEPEDRIPGWRNRTRLARYDLSTGVMEPLTFGHRSVQLTDISEDGNKLLIRSSHSRLTQRPTTLSTLMSLDLTTMACDTLVADDGFIGGGYFSPDGKQVVVAGTPESLDGVGKNVPEGRTPSMTDNQLYLINVADHKVTPLTRDFAPSVEDVVWSRADGMIYVTAENRDRKSLYRINPSNLKITPVNTPEDMINSISVPATGATMAFAGQGAMNSDRIYTLDTKSMKTKLIDDLSARKLEGVRLAECKPWSFVNSRGDSIHGRYYLPDNFDSAKTYPMIVNYYGGCSPTGRNFESRYPHQVYAAQGYIVFAINPSGATGFGQEFSSRHVNTAGEGVADDIIEGTKRFCDEHPFVDRKHIGCIGASYGGFMTQFLQTRTDIFAAAISHAGISDHTSYWGEGYWGYSYSEVSMANSYPWSHPDLYVKQSPLFNADKINTPLLFLHGDADTNVPVGESIQMFTALKLLGKPTAFVAVAGENHHILDHDKRIKWQNTIDAWFEKWLKEDPTWWNSIYKPKSL